MRATDDAREIGPIDLAMVCVKLWDTDAALREMRPLVGPATALVSFQNGVMQAAALQDGFPGAPIIGGVAYVATTISRPGVISRTGPLERLVFGELDATCSPQAEAFLRSRRT